MLQEDICVSGNGNKKFSSSCDLELARIWLVIKSDIEIQKKEYLYFVDKLMCREVGGVRIHKSRDAGVIVIHTCMY